MNPYLLTCVSLAYLWTAANFYLEHKYGLSLAFAAYAIANVGFIYA